MRCMGPSDDASGLLLLFPLPAMGATSRGLWSQTAWRSSWEGVFPGPRLYSRECFSSTPPDTAGAVAGAPTALPQETQTLINPSSLHSRSGPHDSLSDHWGLPTLTSCRLKASAPP